MRPSRRGLFAIGGGLIAAAGTTFAAHPASMGQEHEPHAKPTNSIEAFWGVHQGGIVTPPQNHCYFAAFDLTTERRDDVVQLLRTWTDAAARLTSGQTAQPLVEAADVVAADLAEALGVAPSRLTLTFGFGPGLFMKQGKDRYGLAAARPDALVDLPRFNGDQLVAEKTGGDLPVQACADDPQVAFHAVRQLARLTYDTAQLRWAQTGFRSTPADGGTPRNLMGLKDGTQTPEQIDRAIWVGDEGPAWMRGGSYLVVRRIRMALETWGPHRGLFQETDHRTAQILRRPPWSERRIRAAGPGAK